MWTRSGMVLFTVFFITICVEYLSGIVLSSLHTLQLSKLAIIYKPMVCSHIHSLKYECFESTEKLNTIEHVTEDFAYMMQRGFSNIVSLCSIATTISSLAIVIAFSAWGIAVIYVCLMIPIILIARRSGSEAHGFSLRVSKLNRRAKYYRRLLTGREFAPERTLYEYEQKISRYWQDTMDERNAVEFKSDRRIFTRSKVVSISFTLTALVISVVLIFGMRQGMIDLGTFISLFISLSSFVHMLSWNLGYLLKEYVQLNLFLSDIVQVYGFPVQA